MDVSLTFCLCPHGAMIFPGPLWPNQWAYFKPQGVIWKIWISSFHRYLLLYCGLSGLVTAHCQSRVLFDIFPKIWIFHNALKTNFWKLFSNCSHLKTIWWKFVKPTGNSHKYPKFSYAERSSQKYWAVSELLKFEVLAPCGRHANEVICPYPLACPCLCIPERHAIAR